ncbi:MAG: hypothetical protein L0Y72_01170 [Gemmataceae bacterium]|nr:hypothetical protein [Gemmataceae bacterium]MCI0737623.1 hypothetical protein [Gemmataceae bacterium]
MRSLVICIVLLFSASVFASGPADRVKEHFKSENFTVRWTNARSFDSNAVLEIGDGYGHFGTLGWMRFRPAKGFVDVLHIQLDEGREPYCSKWPPDRAPVAVTQARMKLDAYSLLLRDLAVVDAAKLKPIERRGSFTMSSLDFWVFARLKAGKKTLVDYHWAGYWTSSDEIDFAQSQAAVALAREAVKGLDFKAHSLTEEERSWASAKFVRDWKEFRNWKGIWWVRERYVTTIGVVGDKTVLPALRDLLREGWCVYYAINAVTRLTQKDVRDRPVEEMDLQKTRRKVLEMLDSSK